MIDAQTRNSPGWWLKRLIERLAERRDHYESLDVYYRGENGIPVHADKAVRQAYQRLMAQARSNFAELVVEATRERMQPVAFRTGADADELGDDEAWRIWQANSLDADSALVHRDKLAMGMGYVIVGGPDDEIGAPLITPEDPREVIAETDPRRRRKVVAALKVFADDVEGADRAYLYLPGVVFKAARPSEQGQVFGDMAGWEWDGSGETLPPDVGPVVPVVPFPNKSRTSGTPKGEYEPHLGILDRINYTILNRLEIATLQAFRQRALKGVPVADAQGNEIDYDDILSGDPGAFWLLPASAEIWESQQVDLGPIRSAIRDDVQDLAAVTRTPLFYLTPEAANGSAEGASLAREGLVFKAEDRITETSESWEQVMSLGFLFNGDTARANRQDMEVLWRSPERFSLAERADAAVKAMQGGMSWRATQQHIWQHNPQEIARQRIERAEDALLAPEPDAAA